MKKAPKWVMFLKTCMYSAGRTSIFRLSKRRLIAGRAHCSADFSWQAVWLRQSPDQGANKVVCPRIRHMQTNQTRLVLS